jgi:hypothetical protein
MKSAIDDPSIRVSNRACINTLPVEEGKLYEVKYTLEKAMEIRYGDIELDTIYVRYLNHLSTIE